MNARRLSFAFVLLATSLAWTQPYQYPFQNPSLPVEVRVDNILSLMTLEEKISALSTSPDVPAGNSRLRTHRGSARRCPRRPGRLGGVKVGSSSAEIKLQQVVSVSPE